MKSTEPITTAFMVSPPTESRDATAWHTALPRPMRKALRVATPKRTDARGTDLINHFRMGYQVDTYHNTNLTDPEPLTDEFQDIDDELDGLTITGPMDEAELWRFCTGYDVL